MKFSKELTSKIIQKAYELDSNIKIKYIPLPRKLYGKAKSELIIEYIIAYKLGLLNEYKEIFESKVYDSDKYGIINNLNSILNIITSEDSITKVILDEFVSLLPETVLTYNFYNKDDYKIIFHKNNQANITENQFKLWLRQYTINNNVIPIEIDLDRNLIISD